MAFPRILSTMTTDGLSLSHTAGSSKFDFLDEFAGGRGSVGNIGTRNNYNLNVNNNNNHLEQMPMAMMMARWDPKDVVYFQFPNGNARNKYKEDEDDEVNDKNENHASVENGHQQDHDQNTGNAENGVGGEYDEFEEGDDFGNYKAKSRFSALRQSSSLAPIAGRSSGGGGGSSSGYRAFMRQRLLHSQADEHGSVGNGKNNNNANGSKYGQTQLNMLKNNINHNRNKNNRNLEWAKVWKGLTVDDVMLLQSIFVSPGTGEKALTIVEFVNVIKNLFGFNNNNHHDSNSHSNNSNNSNQKDRISNFILPFIDLFNRIDVNGEGIVEWDDLSTFIVDNADIILKVGIDVRRLVPTPKIVKRPANESTYKLVYLPTARKFLLCQTSTSGIRVPILKLFEETTISSSSNHDSPSPTTATALSDQRKKKNLKNLKKKKKMKMMNNSHNDDDNDNDGFDSPYQLLAGNSLETTGYILDAVHMHDMHNFAISTTDRSISIISESTLSTERVIPTLDCHMVLLYSGTKKFMFSGCLNGNVFKWEPKTFTLIAKKRIHSDCITSIIELSEVNALLTASVDGKIIISELDALAVRHELMGHTKGVLSMVFNANRLLFSCGYDRDILVWNPVIAQPLFRLSGHKECVVRLFCAPKGQELISVDILGNIGLWDIRSYQLTQMIEHHKEETAVDCCFDVQTEKLLMAYQNWYVYSFTDSKKEASNLPILALRYNTEFQTFIVAVANEISIWDGKCGKCINKFANDDNDAEITSIEIHPLCRQIAIGHQQGYVKIVSYTTGGILKHFRVSEVAVENMTFLSHGDSHEFAVAVSDTVINVYDLNSEYQRDMYLEKKTPKCARSLKSSSPFCVMLNVSDYILVAGRRSFDVWKPSPATLIQHRDQRNEADYTAGTISPSRGWVILAHDSPGVEIWTTDRYRLLYSFSISLTVRKLSYSLTSNILITDGNNEGELYVWKLPKSSSSSSSSSTSEATSVVGKYIASFHTSNDDKNDDDDEDEDESYDDDAADDDDDNDNVQQTFLTDVLVYGNHSMMSKTKKKKKKKKKDKKQKCENGTKLIDIELTPTRTLAIENDCISCMTNVDIPSAVAVGSFGGNILILDPLEEDKIYGHLSHDKNLQTKWNFVPDPSVEATKKSEAEIIVAQAAALSVNNSANKTETFANYHAMDGNSKQQVGEIKNIGNKKKNLKLTSMSMTITGSDVMALKEKEAKLLERMKEEIEQISPFFHDMQRSNSGSKIIQPFFVNGAHNRISRNLDVKEKVMERARKLLEASNCALTSSKSNEFEALPALKLSLGLQRKKSPLM